MKRLACLLLALLLLTGPALADGSDTWRYHDGQWRTDTYLGGWTVPLKMRLSTRTGPSTNYDELGSYYKKGYELTALSRAWDDRNGIWWVQVEFAYKGTPIRAYTGLKRVDIDVSLLQDEYPLYYASVRYNTLPYTGPGTYYRPHKNAIPAGTEGLIYGFEDGWVQFEFYEAPNDRYRRVWLPEGNVYWQTPAY